MADFRKNKLFIKYYVLLIRNYIRHILAITFCVEVVNLVAIFSNLDKNKRFSFHCLRRELMRNDLDP